jgi:Protein of unknown function (DUF1631)
MNAESYTNDSRASEAHYSADVSSENNYQTLIHSIYDCVNTKLLRQMKAMLDSASEVLFDLSEKSDTTEMQHRYMDVMSRVRIERSKIESGFFLALNNKLKTQQGFAETSDSRNELELVGRDEMEEMVMITKLSADAMNAFGEEINNLEARLEYLEITVPDLFEKSALNPTGLCEAFQQTLKSITMMTPAKLIMFDLFDRSVCSQLGDMYRELNQLLIEAGILPEIMFKTQHYEEPEEEAVVRTASYYDPQSTKTDNYIKRSQQEIDHMVSQFMNGFTVAEGEGIPASFSVMPTDKDRLTGYSRKQVSKALSRLQSKLLNSGDHRKAIDTEQIKRELMQDMASTNGGAITKKVSILDERSIDFVGMMFNAIADDENISQAITSMLKRLQIAVTKVALVDQNLFSSENHPARRTLDLITEAGKGVVDEEDTVCQDLQSIVDDILEDYEADIATFENAVDSLQQLIGNQQQLADANEKEAQRTIIKQHAREVVLTELRYASSNKHLPEQVQPLVLKHWSTLMLNRYIRYGKDSQEWIESSLLLKLLIDCLQPIQNRKQLEMVKINHLPLVSAVNDELYATQQDKSQIDDQVEKLKQTFIRMIDDYGYEMVYESPAAPVKSSCAVTDAAETASNVVEFRSAANASQNVYVDDTSDEGEIDEADADKAQIELLAREAKDKLAQLPDDVKPGVWFQIFNGEDHAVRRLKLSVILTEVAKLIFVDCHGVKVIEKDAGDFVSELSEQKSRSIADHSTFEHALGQVIHSLAA